MELISPPYCIQQQTTTRRSCTNYTMEDHRLENRWSKTWWKLRLSTLVQESFRVETQHTGPKASYGGTQAQHTGPKVIYGGRNKVKFELYKIQSNICVNDLPKYSTIILTNQNKHLNVNLFIKYNN